MLFKKAVFFLYVDLVVSHVSWQRALVAVRSKALPYRTDSSLGRDEGHTTPTEGGREKAQREVTSSWEFFKSRKVLLVFELGFEGYLIWKLSMVVLKRRTTQRKSEKDKKAQSTHKHTAFEWGKNVVLKRTKGKMKTKWQMIEGLECCATDSVAS